MLQQNRRSLPSDIIGSASAASYEFPSTIQTRAAAAGGVPNAAETLLWKAAYGGGGGAGSSLLIDSSKFRIDGGRCASEVMRKRWGSSEDGALAYCGAAETRRSDGDREESSDGGRVHTDVGARGGGDGVAAPPREASWCGRSGGGAPPPPCCARGHWKPAEDAKLKELVARHGPQNWNLIAEKLPGRSGKSCRLRWYNQLDPRIDRRPFTDEEERRLEAAHSHYGNKWALIARMFPGRTDNAVKNHWHVLTARRSRLRQQRIMAAEPQPSDAPSSSAFFSKSNRFLFTLPPNPANLFELPTFHATSHYCLTSSTSLPRSSSSTAIHPIFHRSFSTPSSATSSGKADFVAADGRFCTAMRANYMIGGGADAGEKERDGDENSGSSCSLTSAGQSSGSRVIGTVEAAVEPTVTIALQETPIFIDFLGIGTHN